MPALNFKAEFADMVEIGMKRQTVRLQRKRPILPGDDLYLYTGMRTKECRKLKTVICSDVLPVKIGRNYIDLSNSRLSVQEVKWFTKEDGFEWVMAFFGFFDDHYGLPFEGVVIKW